MINISPLKNLEREMNKKKNVGIETNGEGLGASRLSQNFGLKDPCMLVAQAPFCKTVEIVRYVPIFSWDLRSTDGWGLRCERVERVRVIAQVKKCS
jgi:hypothetical protein